MRNSNGSEVEILLDVLQREFLRRAYATLKTGKSIHLKKATEVVQEARQGLGLQPFKGNTASGYIQKLTEGYSLNEGTSKAPIFKKTKEGSIEPAVRGWKGDWRKVFAPTHRSVRWLEHTGDIVPLSGGDMPGVYRFAPMDPAFPDVDVIISDREHVRKTLSTYERKRCDQEEFGHGIPGLYFYSDVEGKLYVGRTDEPSTRVGGPDRRVFSWFVFIVTAPTEDAMDSDVLRAAESFAITLWREIAIVANGNDGSDKAPRSRIQLREASAFVTVASAALLKLHRSNDLGFEKVQIPFCQGIRDSYAGGFKS